MCFSPVLISPPTLGIVGVVGLCSFVVNPTQKRVDRVRSVVMLYSYPSTSVSIDINRDVLVISRSQTAT